MENVESHDFESNCSGHVVRVWIGMLDNVKVVYSFRRSLRGHPLRRGNPYLEAALKITQGDEVQVLNFCRTAGPLELLKPSVPVTSATQQSWYRAHHSWCHDEERWGCGLAEPTHQPLRFFDLPEHPSVVLPFWQSRIVPLDRLQQTGKYRIQTTAFVEGFTTRFPDVDSEDPATSERSTALRAKVVATPIEAYYDLGELVASIVLFNRSWRENKKSSIDQVARHLGLVLPSELVHVHVAGRRYEEMLETYARLAEIRPSVRLSKTGGNGTSTPWSANSVWSHIVEAFLMNVSGRFPASPRALTDTERSARRYEKLREAKPMLDRKCRWKDCDEPVGKDARRFYCDSCRTSFTTRVRRAGDVPNSAK